MRPARRQATRPLEPSGSPIFAVALTLPHLHGHLAALGVALESLLEGLELDEMRGLAEMHTWRVEVELTACVPPNDPSAMGLNSLDQICTAFGLEFDLCLASIPYDQFLENARHVLSFAKTAGAFEGLDDSQELPAEKRALGVRLI